METRLEKGQVHYRLIPAARGHLRWVDSICALLDSPANDRNKTLIDLRGAVQECPEHNLLIDQSVQQISKIVRFDLKQGQPAPGTGLIQQPHKLGVVFPIPCQTQVIASQGIRCVAILEQIRNMVAPSVRGSSLLQTLARCARRNSELGLFGVSSLKSAGPIMGSTCGSPSRESHSPRAYRNLHLGCLCGGGLPMVPDLLLARGFPKRNLCCIRPGAHALRGCTRTCR